MNWLLTELSILLIYPADKSVLGTLLFFKYSEIPEENKTKRYFDEFLSIDFCHYGPFRDISFKDRIFMYLSTGMEYR